MNGNVPFVQLESLDVGDKDVLGLSGYTVLKGPGVCVLENAFENEKTSPEPLGSDEEV